MFFKSTKNRTAKQLLQQMDSLGGLNNAYTGCDRTCYYGKVTITDAEKFFDIMSDCFFNGLFLDEEMETEKGVVCSEIDKYEDDFMDCCIDGLNSELFKGTKFSHPILGSKKSVMSITKEDLKEYRQKNNSSGHLIISVCGGVSFEDSQKYVEKYIIPKYTQKETPIVYKNHQIYLPKIQNILVKITKETNQVYFLASTPTIRSDEDEFLKLQMGSIMFGGTMSSRLFERMREKEGIVYHVQSSTDSTSLCGTFNISFITEKSTAERALKAYKEEVVKVIESGFSEKELDNTKHLLKTNITIANEDIDSRARKNAIYLLTKGEKYNIDETLEKVSNIKLDELNNAFIKMLNQNFIYSTVSKNGDLDILKILK